ncbi:hypothetical protein [Streptomyces sp. 6N223]|uniref:hypothetical protein n=1 Tax=Streptomyces sp. 6N223 TaxID=3457412 RepID=UPI003FD3CC94
MTPQRGDDVPPPPIAGEWRLPFATNEAAKGWGELCASAPGNAHQPTAPSPEHGPPITASVTVTGAVADIIRDLAAVEGRTPEALALEWAAGTLVIPPEPCDVEALAFDDDGPSDLSSRDEEYLRDGLSS